MRYVDKQFLTQGPHEGGSVFCFIETPLVKNIDKWTLDKGGNIHGSIQIRDCHNQIELDFSAGRQNEYEKRVEKIDHMIEMLSAFRKQYVEMWESHQRDVEFKKKEQGKYKKCLVTLFSIKGYISLRGVNVSLSTRLRSGKSWMNS